MQRSKSHKRSTQKPEKAPEMENWDDLRFFLAVARAGGLSGASRQLGVNQSTVSRRIAQLEESLSARLFDRQARGYVLTDLGEKTLTLANTIEDDMLALGRSIQGADREHRGLVRVTTLDEILQGIAPHLKSFCERYPGIDLVVNSDLRQFSLAKREADVAIRPGNKPSEDDVIGRELLSLPRAVYASPSYLKGKKRPRSLNELSDHPLIGFNEGHRGAALFREQVGDARIVFRSNGMTGQVIAAQAGLGIAVLPRFMADRQPKLQRIFCLDPKECASLWLLIHADLRQTARVRAFVDFITERIQGERKRWEGS